MRTEIEIRLCECQQVTRKEIEAELCGGVRHLMAEGDTISY